MKRLAPIFIALLTAACTCERPAAEPKSADPPPGSETYPIVRPLSIADAGEKLQHWFGLELPSTASIREATYEIHEESFGANIEIDAPDPAALVKEIERAALAKGWEETVSSSLQYRGELPSFQIHIDGAARLRNGIMGDGGEGVWLLVTWDPAAKKVYLATDEPD